MHPAAFEKELAPVAIAELDPIRVGADGVIAGSQGLPDFEVNPRHIRGNDLATSGAGVEPAAWLERYGRDFVSAKSETLNLELGGVRLDQSQSVRVQVGPRDRHVEVRPVRCELEVQQDRLLEPDLQVHERGCVVVHLWPRERPERRVAQSSTCRRVPCRHRDRL